MILKIKYFLLFVTTFFLFESCRNIKETNTNFDTVKAKKIFYNNKNVIVLPCVACGCFKPALADAYKKDSIFFNSIYIVADTSCSSYPFKYSHLSQRGMDSLSEDFYNVTLIKFKDDNYKVKIINSEDNKDILGIAKAFFDL